MKAFIGRALKKRWGVFNMIFKHAVGYGCRDNEFFFHTYNFTFIDYYTY